MSTANSMLKYENLCNINQTLWNPNDEKYIQNARFFNGGQYLERWLTYLWADCTQILLILFALAYLLFVPKVS